MSPLLFAIGTFSTWIGLLLLVRLVWKYAVGGALQPSELGWVGVLLLVAAMLRPTGSGAKIPLVWFVMPFWAWAAVGCFVASAMALARRRTTSLAWLSAAFLCASLFKRDPEHTVRLLRGGIELSLGLAAGMCLLLFGGAFAIGWASRSQAIRSASGAAAKHALLIGGSILFSVPLAFLMVTSFKEDRDLVSPDGIVWIPRVQRTVPFRDPQRPLYATTFEGQSVEGNLVERRADGQLRLDVVKPFSLRGTTVIAPAEHMREIDRQAPIVQARFGSTVAVGRVIEESLEGKRRVEALSPAEVAGRTAWFQPSEIEPVRDIGLRWQNYSEAVSFLPPETLNGLLYLRNTLILVVMGVLGSVLSAALAAYAFARMRFPGRDLMFAVMLGTMMLPAAVTMLPQFLIFRSLGWIDTLLPLWVPAFLGSALNIFMLRQFFRTVPMELEDAAKIDGCSFPRTLWSVMLPQVRPALAVIAIGSFMGAWNNFMGPLIYVNSPEKMPLSYALALFMGDRTGEPALLMAFSTLTVLPVIAVFFFAQRYFIEGVTLSGFGGR